MTSGSDKSYSLYQTAEQTCSYLPDQTAQMVLFDPNMTMDRTLYSQLIKSGFRRTGDQIYRPHCPTCHACQSLRIVVNEFLPNRSQRRIWLRNQDIEIKLASAQLNEEQFTLFQHYLNQRHPGGGMDKPEFADSQAFFASTSADTRFIEFRLKNRLIAVAVTDLLESAISAVYTFFDPNLSQRSLGNFAILWQLDYCKHQGLNWLYLGYWIQNHKKMSYKQNFHAHQILTAQGWQAEK